VSKGYSSQDVALAIIGAGLANAIALVLFDGALNLWNTIVGIIILCILQAYAPAPTSSSRLNIAYAATWSISLLATVGVVFNMIFGVFVVNGLLSFPNYGSPSYTPYPNFRPFPVYNSGAFTPFNAYDVFFFLAWLAIFIIYYKFFSPMRNRSRTNSATPQEQPKPVLPKPGPETLRANDSGTPTTSGHQSDTPKSGIEEAH
jgi:hypothetical protein